MIPCVRDPRAPGVQATRYPGRIGLLGVDDRCGRGPQRPRRQRQRVGSGVRQYFKVLIDSRESPSRLNAN